MRKPLFRSNIKKLETILKRLKKSRTMNGSSILIRDYEDQLALNKAKACLNTAMYYLEKIKN